MAKCSDYFYHSRDVVIGKEIYRRFVLKIELIKI